MQQLIKDITELHNKAIHLYKMNDASNYFCGSDKHLDRCQEKSHYECWALGSRARIVREATGRFLYLLTGEQPTWCNLKTKPELNSITYYIVQNSEDIVSDNYRKLMDFKNRIKELGFGEKIKKAKK